jgi:hypothetical protein
MGWVLMLALDGRCGRPSAPANRGESPGSRAAHMEADDLFVNSFRKPGVF